MRSSSAGRAVLALALVAAPAAVSASGIEISGFFGATAPTYSQTFSYVPPDPPRLPGVTIDQSGSFDLTATGGLAYGASLTFFATDAVGIEARIDTGDVDLETRNAVYSVQAPLPPPLPDLDADFELEPARVDLSRVRPLSLNLRLRVPGTVSLNLSGGVSYLPELDVEVVQPLAIGVTGLDLFGGVIDVGELPVIAGIDPEADGSRLGANAGIGIQIRLGESVSLGVDARGFLFPEQRLVWSEDPANRPNALERPLLDEVLRQLEPIEFTPTLINVTASLAISF